MLRMRILVSFFLILAIPAMAAVPKKKAYDRPLTFEANHGQFINGVLYAARGPEYSVVIDRHGASLHLDESTLRLQLIGANAASHIEAIDELPAKSAYFIGNDPAKWTRNIPNFARVRQAGVWPGIDAIYYGNETQLEFDLVVAPGADPSRIALRFRGANHVALDDAGRLHLRVGNRDVIQNAPVVYQTINGARREIAGRYVVDGSRIGFRIGHYDRSQPLIIDPVLVYSTYFGQPGFETYIHFDRRPRRQSLHHRLSRHQGFEHAAVLARRQLGHLRHQVRAGRTDAALLDLLRQLGARLSARDHDRSGGQRLRSRLGRRAGFSDRQPGAGDAERLL